MNPVNARKDARFVAVSPPVAADNADTPAAAADMDPRLTGGRITLRLHGLDEDEPMRELVIEFRDGLQMLHVATGHRLIHVYGVTDVTGP